MKLFSRIIIMIFFFAFTTHEVRGNDFLRNIHVTQKNKGISISGKNTSRQFQSDLIENEDFCSVDQDNDEERETSTPLPDSVSFHKYLSCLFAGLITEPIAARASGGRSAETMYAPTAVPRYILYHNLLMPFS